MRILAASVLLGLGVIGCSKPADESTPASQQDSLSSRPKPAGNLARFRVPAESEIKDSVTLASIRRGRALIHSTPDSLKQYVGASLTCANCHFDDGTQKSAMPLVGAYARFPQYRGRSGKVDVLEDRINDCFVRSLNGKALPVAGKDMHDIVAYLAFLSRGFPVGKDMEGQGTPALDTLVGDKASGEKVFASTCAVCHGVDGHGTKVAPPLWGPRSFNIGAGMARLNTAAAFVKANMPFGQGGTLTDQEAFDVAAFFTRQPRPDFAGKSGDWPKGGKPADARY